jgi:hypothetical protein
MTRIMILLLDSYPSAANQTIRRSQRHPCNIDEQILNVALS